MEETAISTVRIYSNEVIVQSGPYDFGIGFATRFNPKVSLTSMEECSVQILMSPQHLKVFTKLLQEKLEEYELIYGEIFPEIIKNHQN